MKRLIIAICLACVLLPTVAVNAANKTPKKLDLEQFIDDVLNERISPDEVLAIKASLTPAQEKQAWHFFYAKVKPVEHTKEQKEALKREVEAEEQAALPAQGDASIQACDPGAVPDCWRQMIEEAATAGGGSGSQGYYTNALRCDNQEDIDYIFGFWYDASNPDSLRWYSTSSQVAWVLGDLNGYGLSNTEVRLCVGDGSVALAGGADWIKQTIFVKRQ
ncbi:MAG: hypothetical protein JOZ51_05595 [Chloroflexi bacterium]|nr:hypothetical protein [Chloroflexota bacterium]